MNMQFLPGSENNFPDLDDEASARSFYIKRIQNIHNRLQISGISAPHYNSADMLCERYSLVTRMVLSLRLGHISRKQYRELSGLLNSQILPEIKKIRTQNTTSL